MKEIIKPTLVLLVICVVAGGVLAFVYKKTAPIIEENKKIEEENARKEVLPIAVHFEPIYEGEQILFYKGFDQNEKLVGYAFQCAREGYGSTIQTMVGIDTLLQMTGIKIISQQETPGLGANSSKSEFAERFKNKNPATIRVDKDGGNIVSITGATISTRAITNSIREKFLKIREKFDEPQKHTKIHKN
jgi:electron transport complex protein RnfG